MQVSEISQKILKCEGLGFSKAETVKAISEQLGVSRQDVYWHFAKRGEWQNDFFNTEDTRDLHRTIANRNNYVYREACFQYLNTRPEDYNAKVGFLRLMFDVNCKLADLTELEILTREVEEIKEGL